MLPARFFAVFFALALVFAAAANAAVSSEAALSKAQFYLKSGEEASILDSKFVVDNGNYWIIYFHPQNYPNTKNLVVAVSADAGEVVSDEALLQKLHSLDYRLSRFNIFTSDTASVRDVSSWFDKFKAATDDLNNPSSRTSVAYVGYALEQNYSLDLFKVQQALDSIVTENTLMEERLGKASDAQSSFDSEKSLSALNSLVSNYNKTLDEVQKLKERNDKYASALLEAVLSVDASQRSIVSAQLQLIQVPDTLSQELARLAAKEPSFNALFDGEGEAVNDSVKSFLYRKDFIEKKAVADGLYSDLRNRLLPTITSAQKRQAYIDCGMDVKKIEDAWKPIVMFMGSAAQATPAEYDQMNAKMTSLRTLVDAADEKYQKCIAPSKGTPAQQELDYSQFAFPVIIVIILVAFFVFLKRREKAVAAPATEEEPGGKSLWG